MMMKHFTAIQLIISSSSSPSSSIYENDTYTYTDIPLLPKSNNAWHKQPEQ